MSRLFVVGEDALCCALGRKLASEIIGFDLAQPPVNSKGVTRLRPEVPRYIGLARLHPVLCIADTDGNCAARMRREWLPRGAPDNFMLRFAVAESESWLLADGDSLAEFFQVSVARMPRAPDDAPDAKNVLLGLARRSRRREIRAEVVSQADPNKPGVGYNVHLSDYVAQHWRPREAMARSPSLQRAVRRLEMLAEAQP